MTARENLAQLAENVFCVQATDLRSPTEGSTQICPLVDKSPTPNNRDLLARRHQAKAEYAKLQLAPGNDALLFFLLPEKPTQRVCGNVLDARNLPRHSSL